MENFVARGYAKRRLQMTRFPRNVSPRPRVCLLPRGHLRRLSPEKRFATMPAKRGPRLCYIYIYIYALLTNNSPYPSFFHSPYVHHFSLSFAMLYRVWKYFFIYWNILTINENYEIVFLTVKRFLSPFVDRKCEGKWVESGLSSYNVKVKINFSMKTKSFWLNDYNVFKFEEVSKKII